MHMFQTPQRKSEQELKEEEELQLALALSQSEAEVKKQKSIQQYHLPPQTSQVIIELNYI